MAFASLLEVAECNMGSDSSPTIADGKPRSHAPGVDCRRRFARRPCKERPRVRLKPARGAGCDALVRDLSKEGMGLLLLRSFPGGTLLTIQFESKAGLRWSIPAEVKHVRKQRDGSWLVGFRLSRSLTEEEITALLPDFAGSATDKFRRGETVCL